MTDDELCEKHTPRKQPMKKRRPTDEELKIIGTHASSALAAESRVDLQTTTRIKSGELCSPLFIDRVVGAGIRLMFAAEEAGS